MIIKVLSPFKPILMKDRGSMIFVYYGRTEFRAVQVISYGNQD